MSLVRLYPFVTTLTYLEPGVPGPLWPWVDPPAGTGMAFITVESFPARPALTATLAATLAVAGEGINPEPGLT